jgi:hypothetical protein
MAEHSLEQYTFERSQGLQIANSRRNADGRVGAPTAASALSAAAQRVGRTSKSGVMDHLEALLFSRKRRESRAFDFLLRRVHDQPATKPVDGRST